MTDDGGEDEEEGRHEGGRDSGIGIYFYIYIYIHIYIQLQLQHVRLAGYVLNGRKHCTPVRTSMQVTTPEKLSHEDFRQVQSDGDDNESTRSCRKVG